MMSMSEEQIDRYLDGDVAGDEANDVMAWLELPGNVERLGRRAELHVDLRRSLRRRSIQSDAVQASSRGRFFRVSRQRRAIGGTALAVAVCLLIAFMMPGDTRRRNLTQPTVASVVSEIDAVLIKEHAPWEGTDLAAGQYELKQGLLHLRFDGGVMVYIEAPAKFDTLSDNRVLLHAGRLSANVPPEGIGFTVETPEAEVVDFGTVFSVDVEDASSEVHVFDGLVRVQPRLGNHAVSEAIDVRTSQAVRVNDSSPSPVGIALASNRFIRTFDEPKHRYSREIKKLSPAAFYRMGIRDRGLAAEPPQYSGQVLIGPGKRPPHAKGVFAGGSLRVGVDSTGRGGRVDSPPQLNTGQLSLVVFAYLESPTPGGTLATNLLGDEGNFAFALDQNGRPRATARTRDGDLRHVISDAVLPLTTWLHLVVTMDGQQLRIYQNGTVLASAACSTIANSDSETAWFGTDANGTGLWNGRIDELGLFDKALTDSQIANLYQAALEEMSGLE